MDEFRNNRNEFIAPGMQITIFRRESLRSNKEDFEVPYVDVGLINLERCTCSDMLARVPVCVVTMAGFHEESTHPVESASNPAY